MSPLACHIRIALLAGAGLLIATPLATAAVTANDQAQEYIQARKIALKDPKVQAAFDRANERLNERIIEIDPSLKPYVEKHRNQPSAATAKPVVAAASKRPVAVATSAAGGTTSYVVAKGDTLSSIALKYKVSVSNLKSANKITDERKLRVGQKLVIPPAENSNADSTKSKPGFWDRLRDSLS